MVLYIVLLSMCLVSVWNLCIIGWLCSSVIVLRSLSYMVWGSSVESAFELATRYMFRLYFVLLVPCDVGVCGTVAIF